MVDSARPVLRWRRHARQPGRWRVPCPVEDVNAEPLPMTCTRAKGCGVPTPLQLYFREIRDDALLTAEQELALADAIAHGDREARSRMIRANLRLVVKIARDYVGRGSLLDDLIGEGNLGL